MTKSTVVVIVANCILAVVGVLQGIDWIHVAGSSTAGWVAVALAGINAVAHAITGADGLMSVNTGSNSTVK